MKKNIAILEYELPVIVTLLKEGGYLAHCEELQGCMAEGKTIKEAMENVTDVALQIIDIRMEEGLSIPLKIVKKINTKAISAITIPLIYHSSHV